MDDLTILGMNYSETLKEYGPNDPRALKWSSKESQYFRFKILCEIADLTDAFVVDYGCGVGDLYDYLMSQGFKGVYWGLDENPDMIAAAKLKYPTNFMGGNDIPGCDYVLMSGVFNEDFEGRDQAIKDTLTRAFAASAKGVAYNGVYEGMSGVTDPLELIKFCETLTPFMTLRKDYRKGSFTLYLYKNKGVDF